MRCDEVVRELAAPTGNRDREAMAEHLAACSACAEWARRAGDLDRLWGATRPAEPTSEGVEVHRPLRHVHGAESQYLYDIGRRYGPNDPAVASLGRRIHELRDR